jgi:hypothetical protein
MWIWSIIAGSIGTSIVNALLAVLLSIVGVCLYMWLLKALCGQRSLGTVAVAGSLLWILVAFQSVLIGFGLTAKKAVNRLQEPIEQAVGFAQSQSPGLTTEDLVNRVCDQVPMVSSLVDVESLKEQDAQHMANSLFSAMNRTVNSYIWRRIYWIVGFCIAALILILVLPGDTTTANVATRSNRTGRSRTRTEPMRRSYRPRR